MDIDIKCDTCGDALVGYLVQLSGGITLCTEPCDRCLEEARKEGYEEGYENGFESGELKGYPDGYDEGYETGRTEER